MRRLLLWSLSILLAHLATASAWAQDIACTPTVALANQHRTSLKHRDPADPSRPTVNDVLQWAAPEGISNPKTRKRDVPIDPHESQVFTVEGDLWRVMIEDNDCDFHLELTTPGKSKSTARIIVEVPQGPAFTAMREHLITELTANGYRIAVGKDIALDEPLRVTVTGFAFYDSAHYSKKNLKKGHGHGTKYVGTLWELHPIWNIVFSE